MNPIRVTTKLCPIAANRVEIRKQAKQYEGFLFIAGGKGDKGFNFCIFRNEKLLYFSPSESTKNMFGEEVPDWKEIYFLSIEGLACESGNYKFANLDIGTADEIEKMTSNDMNILLTLDFKAALVFDKEEGRKYFYNMSLEKMFVPKVGGYCLHYNVLSEILEVSKISGDKYNLKLKSFFDEGTMVHSTSIYNLVMSNKEVKITQLSAVTMVTGDSQKVVCICDRHMLPTIKEQILEMLPNLREREEGNDTHNWFLDYPKQIGDDTYFYSGDYELNQIQL